VDGKNVRAGCFVVEGRVEEDRGGELAWGEKAAVVEFELRWAG